MTRVVILAGYEYFTVELIPAIVPCEFVHGVFQVTANENTKKHYDLTAAQYDKTLGNDKVVEHTRALELLVPRYFSEASSVLDIGTGTGRALEWLSSHFSERKAKVDLTGVEPSTALAEIARKKVPSAKIVEGSGESLPFAEGSFDLVTITGVLHHVEFPKQVLTEAFRVSRFGVLISDHNNFSFGSRGARKLRLGLYAANLLSAFTYVRLGFRRQGYSEGDGWWYPYSLLNDFDVISKNSEQYAIVPTRRPNSGLGNFMLSNSHIAVACIKKTA
ncbi:class I SAM-dependent methyltransferase [Palleronia sp. KMU-117]|uniref:class I SAM-dependent methyltransferase n=1 Tax=Palleronia sp. KMU-117 TaxID=3434108 RepID=UPI003D740CA9